MSDFSGQAFPRNYAYQNPEAGKSELKSEHGLTRREYFAAKAMQGLCAYPKDMDTDHMTGLAVAIADSLIEALNK